MPDSDLRVPSECQIRSLRFPSELLEATGGRLEGWKAGRLEGWRLRLKLGEAGAEAGAVAEADEYQISPLLDVC